MGSSIFGDEKPQDGKCELLGFFGLLIQFLLGCACFSVLVIKRQIEHPKRPIIVWILDVSKQGVSTLLIHFLNLFLAVTFSDDAKSDACVWYLDNVLIDGSLGVIFQWILVRVLEILARKLTIDALISGCYYSHEVNEFSEKTINYGIWGAQMGIWCIITAISKFINYIILTRFSAFWIDIGMELLENFVDYPKLELVFVMIIVPLLMSCIQYWVTDNFLQESDESRIERLSRGKEKLIQIGPEYFNKNNKEIHVELKEEVIQ